MGARAEWRRGWPIVLGAALGGGTGGALFFYISSLFVEGLSNEFGWSRGEIATVYAVAGLGALGSPVIGWLVDRYGFKPVATAATLGLVTLYLVFANYTGSLAVFVAISAFYGLFAVGTAALVYTRPVNAWFDHSRGLALGVSTLGVSVAAIIAPPLLQAVIGDHGWRAGYLVLAALAGGIGLPAMLLLVRSQPPAPLSHGPEAITAPPPPPVGVDVRVAIRTPWFWLLAVALMMINAAGTGLLSQLAPMLQERGLSPAVAAQALSLYAAGLIVGRLGCGALLDRLPPARVAAAFTLAPAIGCALLFAGMPALAFAAALFIGMQQGAETDVMAWFISRIFGMRCYGAIFGAILGVGYLGTMTGILLMGWTHVWTGAYDLAVIGAAGAFAVGALAFLMIGKPRPVTA
jgi:MFS family permease